MKKIYLILAAAVGMTITSCTNDTIVGDANNAVTTRNDGAIEFGSVYKGMTRADHIEGDAADLLNNNFVVLGVKSDGTLSNDNPVFDHYNVNWVTNTANTTTSNTNDWEYVGIAKHALANAENAALQSIKYWDYAKSQYDFVAFSAGKGNTAVYTGTPTAGQVKISKVDVTKLNGVDSDTDGKIDQGAYTIEGKAADLAKVYIADLVTAYRADNDYQNVVRFNFRSLSAKVRVALYETVPGYSVKDVVFYTNGTTAATDGKSYLYTTGTDVFNNAGTYVVYYPTTGSANKTATDYNKAHLSFIPAASEGTDTKMCFDALKGSLTAETLAGKEFAEATGNYYLGRSSDQATYAGAKADNYYTVVIPNETGAVLNLKVNYTLVSTDGSGEVINVTGATAQVPAVYAAWKSGYAYTYIFKISQNTNGYTGPNTQPSGLYPITFDAVVTETEDGVQETITTVADPSITTYAKGAIVTANDEYTTGSNIYAIVANGTELTTSNAKLYTVTLETGAAQTINEASVANALAHGTESPTGTWTVTDANGKKMTVTAASGLTTPNKIAAEDAPDGNEISVNCAKFTPAAPTFVPVPADTPVAAGDTYYTAADGSTSETVAADGTAADGQYWTKSSTAGYYAFEYIDGSNKYYKIIKVVDK